MEEELIKHCLRMNMKTIELDAFVKARTHYRPKIRESIKKEIWHAIPNSNKLTYERTSEIFITKGLKKNNSKLDCFIKERHGTDNEGSYISHAVLRGVDF
ncbi:MAG: hypothetical protein RLZZ605_1485 [Bacteroidota bacterium]|jgi:hypothetical protein